MAPKTTNKENDTKSKKTKKTVSTIIKEQSNTRKATKYLRIKCPICFENINKDAVSSTKCGHVFCTQCLKLALKRMSRCPTCRTRLRGPTGHHALYLDDTNICEDDDMDSQVLLQYRN